MIKYELNGETVDVPLNEQEQFEKDNPTAKKVEDKDGDKEKVEEKIIEKVSKDNELQTNDSGTPQALSADEAYTPQALNNQQDQIIPQTTKDQQDQIKEEVDLSQENQEQITDPIIEDPIIEDPIIEDPIIEDPIIEDPIIEEEIVEEEEPYYGIDNVIDEEGDFIQQEEGYQWNRTGGPYGKDGQLSFSITPKPVLASEIDWGDPNKFDKLDPRVLEQDDEGNFIGIKPEYYISHQQEGIDYLKSKLPKIDYKDWDAMSEADKNKIPFWEDTSSTTKETWEKYFDINRPIEFKTDQYKDIDPDSTKKDYFLGNRNLSSPYIWTREFNFIDDVIIDMLDPVKGNYEVTVYKQSTGLKNTFKHKKGYDDLFTSGNWIGFGKYKTIQIKHKDGRWIRFREQEYKEMLKNPEKFGERLYTFLKETTTEGDRKALNKKMHWMADFAEVTVGNATELTDKEKKEITDESLNVGYYDYDDEGNIIEHGDIDFPMGLGGYDLKPGGVYSFNAISEFGDFSNNGKDWTASVEIGNSFHGATIKYNAGPMSRLRDVYIPGEYEEYYKIALDETTNEKSEYGYEPLAEGETIYDRAREIMERGLIDEKQGEKLEDFMDTLDGEWGSDDVRDVWVKAGYDINTREEIEKLRENKAEITHIEDKWLNPMKEDLANIEEKIMNGEQFTPKTQEEFYKENEVFITEEDWEGAKQKIINENPIEINDQILTPDQAGYDLGQQAIIDKYSFPTEEEVKKDLFALEKRVENGEISIEEAEKIWEDYNKGIEENQNNLLKELDEYNTNFTEQAENLDSLINDLIKDQENKKQIADLAFETQKADLENYVLLENGIKVPKALHKQYKDLSEQLVEKNKEYIKAWDRFDESLELVDEMETRNYLIQKNYDNWEKAMFNVYNTSTDLLGDLGYSTLDLADILLGTITGGGIPKMDNVRVNYNDWKDMKDQIRETFKPNVEFKDAFDSFDNFFEFFGDELTTQGPIYLVLGGTYRLGRMGRLKNTAGGSAISNLGILSVGGMGYVEALRTFRADAMNGLAVPSQIEQRFLAVISAFAEGIDGVFTRLPFTNALKGSFGGKTNFIKDGKFGLKRYLQNNVAPGTARLLLDMGSEAATTIIQNWTVNRPRYEDVDHATFSAGMFNVLFQTLPFVKGAVLSSFSSSKTMDSVRNRLIDIDNLRKELYTGKLDTEARNSIEEQIIALQDDVDVIMDGEINKMNNLGHEFTETFFSHVNKGESLKIRYNKIENSNMNPAKKKELLKEIEAEYDNNQALIEILKSDPAFGSKFLGFEYSTKKEDIERRNEIFDTARNELISEGKSDPSDKAIRERSRVIYNTQEIKNDYNSKKENGLLSENFESYDTVDEATEAIDQMNIEDNAKKELKKGIKDGNHGGWVPTRDGKRIPFQVVENMAKGGRLQTRTHEMGHDVLNNLFAENPLLFDEVSDEIQQYLLNNDTGSYLVLQKRMGAYESGSKDYSEEVITNFMEMVAEGRVNLRSKNNKPLSAIVGRAFNNIIDKKTGGTNELDLQSLDDGVSFISTLATRVKDGTVSFRWKTKKGEKSEVAKKYKDAKAKQAENFKYSRASVLKTLKNIIPKRIKTKKDYDKFIKDNKSVKQLRDEILNPGGVINNYIRSNTKTAEEANKIIDAMFISETYGPGRIFNFNPEAIRKKDAYDLEGNLIGKKGKKVGIEAFGEFIFAGHNFMKLDAAKSFVKEAKRTAPLVSGDAVIGETGRTVFENTETEAGMTPEEIMILKQETPAFKKKRQKTLDDLLKLDDNLKQDIVNSLKVAFGTKLPEIATNRKQAKLYETELLKIVTDRVRTKIQKKFGTELAYDEFIKNDLLPLLKFIPDSDLRNMEKMVGGKRFPDGRKILATQVKLGRIDDIKDYQKRGLIPITVDPAKAAATKYNVPVRLPNPNSQELLAFFRGTNAEKILGYQPPGSIKSGMLGTRKDKLAELLTREIAKDYAMQVVRDPKVLQRITDIEALQNRVIKDSYISELGAILDRDPDAGSTNTNNSSVKFSRQSKTVILEQVDLITELIEDLGVRNVIDEDGNFMLFEFIEDVNISAQAVATALEIHDSGVLERGESKQYKTSVYNSEVFTQFVKDALRDQGKLRNKIFDGDKITAEGKKLNKDMGTIAEILGFEIMDLMGYDVLGYYNRLMDSAEQKRGKQEGVSGPFYNDLQSIKGRVSNKKSDISNDVLKDVRLMNKEFNLFGKIQKILDKPISRKDKIAELKPLQAEIKAANIANIKLAKHIVTKVITLARKGKISKLSAINFFQFQTNATRGLRALTRLDLIEVLDGSQTMSENHPQYKQALEYELNKGKLKAKAGLTFEQTVIIKKLTNKGEHINPNANTMFALAELIEKQNINLDAELDLILNDHSQLLSSYHLTDLIDDGPGGRTSTAGFSRLNVLKPETLKNVVGIDGRPFKDILADRSISKLEKNLVREASFKSSKSSAMYQAKNNLIKFSKNPKTKGMSTFDFDDTLARTKSGVRYTIPNNTGKPMPGKKVIFLAGSAGSGKSNVVKQLGLEKQGFKMVNQDISLEWLAKNSGLPTDMRDFTPEQASKWGSLQWEARDIAQRKATKFRGRGDGVVVDGTGASTISMFTQAQKYKDAGYDVQMLFVDSSLETALERNKARKERSLQDFIVERNWKAVQKNKKAFKEEFGSNFAEVNTDKLKQGDAMPKSLVNKIDKFTNSYIKGRLTAEEFASKGGELLDQGAKFDFSEFNKVVDGTPGPLLEKARNRAKKYGTKDMFVLTARPQQSAFAIQQFLKGQGLDIPIKNITGLANSTGDAKAQWMLDKFAEGYNDMYFVDDAIQNVEAVKQVLDQLDVKSKVVQAKVKFSKNASKEFNTIIEQSKGVKADVVISQAEAIKTGRHKGWWRLFVPPSAEDFKGLLYRFLGTGKQGEQHMEWFKENLLDPFAKGIRSWNTYKQGMIDEYKVLKKDFKNVNKSLYKKVPKTKFTVDSAIRVYLWDKAGFDVPGLDSETKDILIEYVESNTKVKQYADTLSKITRTKEGYIKPKEGWSIGTIASDLNDIVNKIGRKEFLADYLANVDAIFTPDNLNKIEALYGTNFRKALDNILYRMEHGTNRKISQDSNVNGLLDWINGSVGAIMFFNMRSASLQTLSTVNFINWTDNNLFKAGKAFANQPQFWKDFAMLFNSPQLKQRRRGLQTDVSASELSAAFSDGKATPRKVINYLLQLGFTPTQVVDSFAIAFGGASFYRNRFNTYKKRGMSVKEANNKAMLDFQELAEETQQSSREDMVSQQQASVLGRVVLAFQNTTMQYTRLTKKSLSDLANRRGDPKSHISRIMYYSAVQSIVFLSLQQALAASLWGDDEEEKDKDIKRVLNGTLESFLSGMGIHGKIASTIKNTVGVYKEQKAKDWNREDGKILLELLSFSPPIGSKLRKIYQAIRAEYYDSDGKLSEELGWRIESPKLYFWSSIIEAVTNIPTQRLVRKANNLEEAITGSHSMWERIQLALGWSVWELGLEDEDTAEAKERVEEKKAIEKEEKKKEDKIIKEQEKEEEKKREEKEKKEKGIKTVRCSGVRSNGERCGNTTETAEKTWLCYHHMEFTDGDDRDGDGIKEYRCTAIKKDGNRCKNKTENKSKKCYAHQ
tara:strand:+ start:12612 stop:23468 length:10857 start_codon:yes stop_codon:yes gene_type:complete